MAESQQLHVRVRREDGSLWATVDEYPGVLATGDDLDELRESVEEGIASVLADPGQDARSVAVGRLSPGAEATTELVYA